MSLKVKGLRVAVEGKEIIKGLDIEVGTGEVVALMGPNGSGKSSLANVLMGHPFYEIESGELEIDGKDLREMSVDERARAGLFLAFQYPQAIAGVSVRQMLLGAVREREKADGGKKKMGAMELKQKLLTEAKELGMSEEMIERDLNQGFSGGEKKKMEILQMRILKPKYAILDETDSGLDIDALKTVAEGAKKVAEENKSGVLLITHYQRILKYLKPDRVVVMKEGVVVDEGGMEIVEKLEKEGYKIYE